MKEKNIAYIDGQNLHLWTKSAKWQIDFDRFRIYLKDKFKVQDAYYYLGFVSEEEESLYTHLQKAWFILVFREHTSTLKWKKKGNVDVDIVFEIMRNIAEKEKFDKIVLVSGDGDYIKLVKYLISKDKLKRLLFPNRKYSSLYNKYKTTYGMNLSVKEVRAKIEYIKKRKTRKKKNKQKKEVS